MLTNEELKIVKDELEVLKGKEFNCIYRVGWTGTVGFGETINALDRHGIEREYSKYALHIQCSFRIRKNEKCILGWQDLFEPRTGVEWSEDFDYDVVGSNLYDESTEKIREFAEKNPITVEEIEVDKTGDLRIDFSDGMMIEVFVDNTCTECWRFFERKSDWHLVVCGDGLEE